MSSRDANTASTEDYQLTMKASFVPSREFFQKISAVKNSAMTH